MPFADPIHDAPRFAPALQRHGTMPPLPPGGTRTSCLGPIASAAWLPGFRDGDRDADPGRYPRVRFVLRSARRRRGSALWRHGRSGSRMGDCCRYPPQATHWSKRVGETHFIASRPRGVIEDDGSQTEAGLFRGPNRARRAGPNWRRQPAHPPQRGCSRLPRNAPAPSAAASLHP